MVGTNCPNCRATNVPTKYGLKRFCWRCGYEIDPQGLDRLEDSIDLNSQLKTYKQVFSKDDTVFVTVQFLIIIALLVLSGFLYNYYIPSVLGQLITTPLGFGLETTFWALMIYALTTFACYLQRTNNIGEHKQEGRA